MGGLSWVHWVIVLGIAMLLFGGKGKISDLMGDVAKGIKSFKKGLTEDETTQAAVPPKPLESKPGDVVPTEDKSKTVG